MEGEVYNLMLEWVLALASLLYCHNLGKFIPKGKPRLLAFLPVIFLFFYLPFNFTTLCLSGPSFFFLSWLANFKLLLFAFGQGPLSSNPPLPLSHFILTASLPIKIVPTKSRTQETEKPRISIKAYAIKTIIFLIAFKAHGYKDRLHPLLAKSIYGYYIFFSLDVVLVMSGFVAKALAGVELEPQFDEPHHATSLQNFWGRRWNLMVTGILRSTVYRPSRVVFGHVVPQKWVSVPAVFTTFLVSSIMHEMIFYYMGRLKPTWEVTCFFIIQGLGVGIEIVMKKKLGHKFHLPQLVARSLTLTFVFFTSIWLFIPTYLSSNPPERACKEVMAFLEFLFHGHLRSPNECACPLF